MTDLLRARKRADLLSITGAAVAGVAVGGWLAAQVRPLGWYVLAGGLLAHAVGMTARHRLDGAEGHLPRGWQILYVGCWALIVAILAFGLMRWLLSNAQ